jgi:hypothetical protein
MNIDQWAELHKKTESSYVAKIDLRDLTVLLRAAMDLRMLVEAIKLYAPNISVRDEATRLLELVEGVELLDGPLPCS